MIKKENLREECENYFTRMDIEKFKEEMGIVDEGNIVYQMKIWQKLMKTEIL